MRRLLMGCAILAGGVALACSSDSNGPSTRGVVTVRLADAPADDFQSATVYVSSVTLIGGGTSASGEVISDTKASFDLLTLQNGVTATLGSASVPTGTYSQVRLVVDSARVVLAGGRTFANGSSSAVLRIPSGQETGLKVTFGPPVVVTEGETVLVVDFDVSRSFVFQGPRTSPTGVLFKPVLHAVAADVAASISGTVVPALAAATVYAIAGTDTVATAFANSSSGAYTLRFLPPGSYVVAASATGFAVALSGTITVGAAENRTGVNLTLAASP
jgi:hypothetical protein